MCGRYSLTARIDQLLPRLKGDLPPGFVEHYAPRLLILPGEPLLIQRQEHHRSEVALALWGLLPGWVKDPTDPHRPSHRPINARRETVDEKASFRGAWRHRRCLIPADAFFEKGHSIRRCDGGLFWLAGLWERWIGADGSELDSCCVLTTEPNTLIAPLHNRMPVVIPDGLEAPWLDSADGPGLRALEPLMEPWDPAGWEVVEMPGARKRQLSLFPLDRIQSVHTPG
jgi:putative SOS response-associated peptidase YedK